MTPFLSARRIRVAALSLAGALAAALAGCDGRPAHSATSSDAEAAAPDAHHHAHAHAHGESANVAPPVGGWATDAPLREGMGHIRAAAAPLLDQFGRGSLTSDEAAQFTHVVEEQFARMAQQCQLEPDADAALHRLVVVLLEAGANLERDPTSTSSAEAITHALTQYGRSFADPGWQSLPRGP